MDLVFLLMILSFIKSQTRDLETVCQEPIGTSPDKAWEEKRREEKRREEKRVYNSSTRETRQKGCNKFKGNLNHTMSIRAVWASCEIPNQKVRKTKPSGDMICDPRGRNAKGIFVDTRPLCLHTSLSHETPS
jgi:hypothetical protein